MSSNSPVFAENPVDPDVYAVVRKASLARRLWRRGVHSAILLGLFLLSAEVMARLDDWLYRDVPILATPDKDRDLFVWNGQAMRGRPHGRFKKWRLNAFGFRAPEISRTPDPDHTRVMILGASESFGLYESEGKEFPAQLAQRLSRAGRYEVVNASLPGLTVRSMIPYWEDYVAQFRPDIVIIYPSPLFYLAENWTRPNSSQAPPTKNHRAEAQQPDKTPAPRPRLISHMRNVFHVPEFIQKWRDKWNIEAKTADKSEEWFFRKVPQDRLDFFAADLAELTASIRKHGAQPVLLTHAACCAIPPRLEDHNDLQAMRVHLPRATEEVMPEFDGAANRSIVELGCKHDLPVINVAEVMNGRRQWFADLVHFTDEGASVIAELAADRTLSIAPSLNRMRQASR